MGMGDTVIKVENLGKKYVIRHQQERYTALRDVIANKVKSIGRKKLDTGEKEEFWALKDVSFDIKQGDRVGIIGRNGAGKSTLLKLLSRITEPTTGSIALKGRVSSLLEVGTGFHPELTGRENIYLNGAILGMSKREIKAKFDEIVEFAEVEKFLDTSVKRYSSGMYVRLAFSVAAHMEPEILIVDEVLAVGDAQFQKKCLGKMEDVGKEGRTVLFVSHNMNAVNRICNCGILLEKGEISKKSDDLDQLTKYYLSFSDNADIKNMWINNSNKLMYENEWFLPIKLFISEEDGKLCDFIVENNRDIWINIEGIVENVNQALTLGYAIYNEEGTLLYWTYQTDQNEENWPKLKKGYFRIRSKLPKNLLNEGTYKIEMIGSIHFIKWFLEPGKNVPTVYFKIQGGLSDSPYWIAKRPGVIAPIIEWKAY
jgi:lipopolysaccharide transport system ATP-binding protein